MIGVDEIVNFVNQIGGKLIDRLWPDPTEAAEAKLELFKMQQTGELAQLAADTDLAKAQLAVNQAEASNPHIFVAGWRPFIGWTCGFALAFDFIFGPIFDFIAALFHSTAMVPQLQTAQLVFLLSGMLGLGAMRTKEKLAGKADGLQ